MQTRPTVLFFVLAFVTAWASAQVGPMPYEEPLRPSRTQERVASQPSPAASLDDALIAGSRPLGTIRSESPEKTPQSEKPESQALGASEPRGLVGMPGSAGASNGLMSKGNMMQTILALGGILLLIFGLAQLYKRMARSHGGLAGAIGAGGTAPSGIVEILGRYPVSSKMTLVVMRFDRRILLLSHAGGGRGKNAQMGAMTTLCELDSPEDVASVLLKVRNEEGDSIAQSFERTLREADDYQDQFLNELDYGHERPQVRIPTRSRRPVQVMSNEEGDHAEFGVVTESEAAAGVLRQRLASMRPRRPVGNQHGGTVR